MNVFTEEAAGKKWCPHAGYDPQRDPKKESFHHSQTCVGNNCMAWRWQPLMADEDYVAAVKKAAIEIDDKTPNRAKASKHVNENRAKYGLKTEPFLGSCGIASK